jgi:hypothetical protein
LLKNYNVYYNGMKKLYPASRIGPAASIIRIDGGKDLIHKSVVAVIPA